MVEQRLHGERGEPPSAFGTAPQFDQRHRPGVVGTRLSRLISQTGLMCHAGLDLLFPPECSFCQVSIEAVTQFGLCDDCLPEVSVDCDAKYCSGCGTLSLTDVFGLSKCPECDKRDYRFDQIVPLGLFRGRLRESMIRTKNAGETPLTRSIALLMGRQLTAKLINNPPDVAVSIPKYWLKRLVKGTNSAELLGEQVANILKVPFFPRALHWTRNIRKQSLLSVTERSRNVRGALKLSSGFDVRDAHVLIVDDTMTTGATANEAAGVLKRNGARRVSVTVAARASNLDTLDAVDLNRAFSKAS